MSNASSGGPEHQHHDHHEDVGHGHTHGVVDPTIATTSRGIWAIKWSFVGLGLTAILQLAIVLLSGSVALWADTIHNVSDALTAVPLWIAFLFARKRPSQRFTYGYGRVEDLAGVFIVLAILASAVTAGYVSIDRLLHPKTVQYVWAVAAAGAIGFVGNEAVALLRIRVGKQINSAALVADGYHARADGLTSLAVLAGAILVWRGVPIADPIVGLLITGLILKIVWDSAKSVFHRMLDGVDPEVVHNIEDAASHVKGVVRVSDVRSRWLGHRLEVELHVVVPGSSTVDQAHALAVETGHTLSHAFPFIGNTTVHADPVSTAGISYHHVAAHEHDGLPAHAH
ncbi:MAG: cation diffusion facilitator family transporter [Dehalococcoidia bacterium]|nr:cation diffusion facilitator family transporter [Dehalococcoidia bacterium]